MMHSRHNLAATVFFIGLYAGPALAEDTISYQTLVTPLLESGKTIIGDAIVYPAGTPKVTGAIVTVPPGGETGWHTHAVPLYAYILEGALTVDYGTKGIHTYKTGDSVLEAMNWPHNGRNLGPVPVRLLAVYMGADGVPNAAATK
jgi:quercetin dioxygenase-like cupin family protein